MEVMHIAEATRTCFIYIFTFFWGFSCSHYYLNDLGGASSNSGLLQAHRAGKGFHRLGGVNQHVPGWACWRGVVGLSGRMLSQAQQGLMIVKALQATCKGWKMSLLGLSSGLWSHLPHFFPFTLIGRCLLAEFSSFLPAFSSIKGSKNKDILNGFKECETTIFSFMDHIHNNWSGSWIFGHMSSVISVVLTLITLVSLHVD